MGEAEHRLSEGIRWFEPIVLTIWARLDLPKTADPDHGFDCVVYDVTRDEEMIVSKSTHPYRDACRELLERGFSLRQPVKIFHDGAEHPSVTGLLGRIANNLTDGELDGIDV